jgi:N-acetylneuraminate lyase
MNIKKLKGLIAAPFTPFDGSGELDLSKIPAYYRFLKDNRVAGAFISGSTGEGVSMTIDEKKAVNIAWAACALTDTDFKVISLVGGNCLAECKQLARHAADTGLDAVAFTSPSYFKPKSATVLAEMCAEIAAEVPDLPFYYYHVPVLTGANFDMIRLLEQVDGRIPNFAGIKYTHEDFMDFQSCMNFAGGRYDMLWGRDENMLSALVLGAEGAVGSTFNYAAPLYHDLIQAFENNDLDKARKLQQLAIDMIRLLGKYGGISVGKAYMRLAGMDCGGFRLPVSNMNDENFELFRLDVAKLGFDTFKSVYKGDE